LGELMPHGGMCVCVCVFVCLFVDVREGREEE
jgi:hypothetical protein